MKTFKRPNPVRGGGLPGDREISGKDYRRLSTGQVVRKWPKVRGKAAVKAAKRARMRPVVKLAA